VEDDERIGRPRSHMNDRNAGKLQNMVHSDRGLSINQAYCVEILRWLHEAVSRKRSAHWSMDWILHHDNVSAHK
jgi:hypothetical protein